MGIGIDNNTSRGVSGHYAPQPNQQVSPNGDPMPKEPARSVIDKLKDLVQSIADKLQSLGNTQSGTNASEATRSWAGEDGFSQPQVQDGVYRPERNAPVQAEPAIYRPGQDGGYTTTPIGTRNSGTSTSGDPVQAETISI